MKAMIYESYGAPDVVHLAEVSKPVPGDNEVLIRIRATTVSSGDWRARSLNLPGGFGWLGRPVFGLLRPRQPILGTELSGVIEAVGAAVTRFAVGDAVIGFTGGAFGCHAEYRVMREDGLIVHKPVDMGFEPAAALCFGGTTALYLLRDKAAIQAGDKVLVIGASGAVGSAAVQIARALGAVVTAVTSTPNVELVRGIGAARVIDYTREDFATAAERWDIIIDTTGTAPYARCAPVLERGGRLVAVMGTLALVLGFGRPGKASGHSIIATVPKVTVEHLVTLAAMAAAGALKPVIDRSYPLESAVEAHAYVDSGRKRGSVALTIGPALAGR
jgi:NADPH:quinone reductase-like Zn-dependent oxidoreductase